MHGFIKGGFNIQSPHPALAPVRPLSEIISNRPLHSRARNDSGINVTTNAQLGNDPRVLATAVQFNDASKGCPTRPRRAISLANTQRSHMLGRNEKRPTFRMSRSGSDPRHRCPLPQIRRPTVRRSGDTRCSYRAMRLVHDGCGQRGNSPRALDFWTTGVPGPSSKGLPSCFRLRAFPSSSR